MTERIKGIIQDTRLEFHQKRGQLAYEAENMLPYVGINERSKEYLDKRIICDIFEGHAPYRPRYILPDYLRFMKNGSEYLGIKPPEDLYEAVNALLIIYRYVPSITGYPVYLGQADELLEPYMDTVNGQEAEKLLRLYLTHIDRVMPDAFVHMNIGPRDTKAGRLILKLEAELRKAVPNISMKYSEETPADFARLAVATALEVGKPYFINHSAMLALLGENYGIASCYNSLNIGGGSHTLVRLDLKAAAGLAGGYQAFMDAVLPDAIASLCDIINARARFLVEASGFFQSSFLVREGLIQLSRFTSMAGVFGLYEAVELLSDGLRMGHDRPADDMADAIVRRARELVKGQTGAYCDGTGGKIGFHAQSGIDSDLDVTAGVRIKAGMEPGLFEQIRLQGSLQGYFDTGVSDIYNFDSTAKKNTGGVLKIINGAMKNGILIFALNTADSELVRITGYLVKRSDIRKYENGDPLREGTVKLGADSIKNKSVLERRIWKSDEGCC